MGVASTGISESEDAMTLLHEYGHALLDAQVPGLLHRGGRRVPRDLRRPLRLPGLAGVALRRPGCWGQLWYYFGQPCFRRLDVDAVYPDDLQHEPHADAFPTIGAVYAFFAALLDADGLDVGDCPGTDVCDAVRDRVLGTLLTASGYLHDGRRPARRGGGVRPGQRGGRGRRGRRAPHRASSRTAACWRRPAARRRPATARVAIDIAHAYRGDLARDGRGRRRRLRRPLRAGGARRARQRRRRGRPHRRVRPLRHRLRRAAAAGARTGGGTCASRTPWPEDEGEIRGFTVFDGEVPYLAPGSAAADRRRRPDGDLRASSTAPATPWAAPGRSRWARRRAKARRSRWRSATRTSATCTSAPASSTPTGPSSAASRCTSPTSPTTPTTSPAPPAWATAPTTNPLASGERWFLEVIDTARPRRRHGRRVRA